VYDTPDNAIGYSVHSSRSHDAVIRVYDAAANVIETHEHKREGVVRVYRVKHKGAIRQGTAGHCFG